MADFDAKSYRFSPNLLKKSAGNFKAFLKERYGKETTVKQRKQLLDIHYGKLDVNNDGEFS